VVVERKGRDESSKWNGVDDEEQGPRTEPLLLRKANCFRINLLVTVPVL